MSRTRAFRRRRASAVVLPVLLIALAACTVTPPAASSGASAGPSLDGEQLPAYAAPSSGILDAILERGKIVNGMEAANPPFEYMEGGEIVGYDADLMALFGEYLGVEVENVDTAWSGVIPSLYSQKFDLIWSAMTITEPREEAVNFSAPYGSDKALILVAADNSDITSVDDLNGKVIGTQLNSAAELQIKELAEDEGLEYGEVKSYDHFQDAYLDLKNGNVDAVTGTQLNNLALFENDPDSFEVAFEIPYYNFVAVATRQGDEELLAEVDAFLDEIVASGELAELQEKWFGYEMDLELK